MAATSEPPDGLLAVGHQCSAQYCDLIDFLPFKCQHCERKFCGEHYLPASHKCDKYDERKHNRVAPSCPLCNIPVTIPDGQDPNIPMEQHITNECSVMTGKAKKSNQPHCSNPRCKKLLFAPIRCDKCSQQFCPQHRFPSDHPCKTTTQTSSKPLTNTPSVSTKAQDIASDVSAKSNAAMAAIKRSMASAKSSAKPTPSSSSNLQPPQPIQKSTSSSTSSSSKTNLNPLLKTDRPPSFPSPKPLLTSVTNIERTPSTCADVANEMKLVYTPYRLPSLFASA
ncbi:hypothetical protein BJ322DRAFT_1077185 [Thelephora terrestris]|uniref:AN1-type domain-containing protein n=1 Tax=Thelephora terrestris TaxID=56493 RepID=A0A9P6L4B1_9AGAM|nr:hypothetical protein BJ322DRAFT_1077185 [Thelephora terrestris]